MKTLVLLAAALAAMPASAEVYQCRSDKGAALAVAFEPTGKRLAILEGRKVIALCGRGAALARCGWMGDGGFTYEGRRGMMHLVPESGVFGAPVIFRVQAPGETAWTSYRCGAADAAVRRRFGG